MHILFQISVINQIKKLGIFIKAISIEIIKYNYHMNELNYLNILVRDIKAEIDEFNILREFKRDSIKMW